MVSKVQKAYFWSESFAIVKAKSVPKDFFAIIKDKSELTVVIEESKLNEVSAFGVEAGYKLLTFDMTLPFGMVGFLSRISTALADEKISILAFSSFSTDHLMVKQDDADRTKKVLRKLGFEVA